MIVILVVNWLLRWDVEVDFIFIRSFALRSTFIITIIEVHPFDKTIKKWVIVERSIIAAVVEDKISVEISELLSVCRAHRVLFFINKGLVKIDGELELILLTVPKEGSNGFFQSFNRANILITSKVDSHVIVKNGERCV